MSVNAHFLQKAQQQKKPNKIEKVRKGNNKGMRKQAQQAEMTRLMAGRPTRIKKEVKKK